MTTDSLAIVTGRGFRFHRFGGGAGHSANIGNVLTNNFEDDDIGGFDERILMLIREEAFHLLIREGNRKPTAVPTIGVRFFLKDHRTHVANSKPFRLPTRSDRTFCYQDDSDKGRAD